MSEVRIRHRQQSDLDGCVEVLAVVHQADGYPMNWPSDPAGWLAPAGMLQGWVAVAGEATVIGHVVLQTAGGVGAPAASVGRFFVAPDARGRGLGARLLEHARQWAVARGLNLILEVADSERSAAIELYERSGWRRIETVKADWIRPDGGGVMLHRYVLQERVE